MRITLLSKAGTLGVVGEANWPTASWSLHSDGERTVNIHLGLTGLPGQAQLRQIMERLGDELNKGRP